MKAILFSALLGATVAHAAPTVVQVTAKDLSNFDTTGVPTCTDYTPDSYVSHEKWIEQSAPVTLTTTFGIFVTHRADAIESYGSESFNTEKTRPAACDAAGAKVKSELIDLLNQLYDVKNAVVKVDHGVCHVDEIRIVYDGSTVEDIEYVPRYVACP